MKKILATLFLISFALFLSSCSSASGSSGAMSMGKSDAPVLIEEFSDVQCPACGQISPQVEKLARNNSDIVRLVFYHFPLSYHEYAFTGAEATECAGDQGKGWEYLADLYANQKSLNDDYFYSLADKLGLNQDEFKTCLDNHEKKTKIEEHLREGRARQIPGTPSIFINGEMVQWAGLEAMDGYVKGLVK
jgi:protein-disulfide isomerase